MRPSVETRALDKAKANSARPHPLWVRFECISEMRTVSLSLKSILFAWSVLKLQLAKRGHTLSRVFSRAEESACTLWHTSFLETRESEIEVGGKRSKYPVSFQTVIEKARAVLLVASPTKLLVDIKGEDILSGKIDLSDRIAKTLPPKRIWCLYELLDEEMSDTIECLDYVLKREAAAAEKNSK